MRFVWDERKRRLNSRRHGMDFADVERVFEGTTVTAEDDRLEYGERRFRTIGLLHETVVSVIHTESLDEIRVISFRKATRHEQALFFSQIPH